MRSRFLPLSEEAARGELAAWDDASHTLLALIIILDQFPRNMFRNQARSFATDALALAAAERMVARGWDFLLRPIERWFAYLPYEHAENLTMQKRALELLERVSEDPALADVAAWARKHCDAIVRFGRFPHRNAILGRASTHGEIEFLAQPGSSF